MLGALLIALSFGSDQVGALPYHWHSRFNDSRYMWGDIVLPRDQITYAVAEKIGREVLKEAAGHAFVDVGIFPEDDYPPFHYLLLSHSGYSWWRHGFETWRPSPFARICALASGAVLELRDVQGNVTRTSLAGSDPLEIVTDLGTFRLLHFTFRRIPLAEAKGLDHDSVEVFARSDRPLEPKAGLALLTRLHQLIPFRDIELYVRTDTWFLDVSGYPLVYPFQTEQAPPRQEEFLRSLTLSCGGRAGRYSCSAWHPQ